MSSDLRLGDGLDDALRRVDEVAERLFATREELSRVLLAAHEAGHSTRKIAPHARLSHNRVAELVREARMITRTRDVDAHKFT